MILFSTAQKGASYQQERIKKARVLERSSALNKLSSVARFLPGGALVANLGQSTVQPDKIDTLGNVFLTPVLLKTEEA
jgi:hypothetical protein